MKKETFNVYTFRHGENQGEHVPLGKHSLPVCFRARPTVRNGCFSPMSREGDDLVKWVKVGDSWYCPSDNGEVTIRQEHAAHLNQQVRLRAYVLMDVPKVVAGKFRGDLYDAITAIQGANVLEVTFGPDDDTVINANGEGGCK